MKKKNLRLLLLIIALFLLAAYLVNRDDSSSIRTELMDFGVKDSSDITKVFLADRNGNSVLLQRKANGGWVLNDSFPPRPDMMNNLLRVIHSVSVKSRVPKSGFNNVISELSAGGIKCEVYSKNSAKPSRVYYVGGQTADATGTFMMMENSTVPFVMELPGFTGYLTPWFNPKQEIWLEPILFRYQAAEIKSLSITYPSFPQWSFKLERTGEKFILHTLLDNQVHKNIDSVAVDNYLSLYNNVFYEVPEKGLSAFQKDSLLKTAPINQIEIESTVNGKEQLLIFPMPINDQSMTVQDSLGQPLKYDLDRMFGYLSQKNQWMVIQHFSFDKLFRRGDEFMLKNRRLPSHR